MAGSNPAFNAATFRTQIKSAMQMGSPNASIDKVTFRWKAVKDFASEDVDKNPYDWSSTPVTSSQHADVKVDCAVENSGTAPTEFISSGELNSQKILITLLDVDYAQVVGADFVLWGQSLFHIDFVAPPIALFSVNVHQVYATAVDL